MRQSISTMYAKFLFTLLYCLMSQVAFAIDTDGETVYLTAIQKKNFESVLALSQQSIFPENRETLEAIIDNFSISQVSSIYSEFKNRDSSFTQITGKWKFFNPIIYALGKGRNDLAQVLTNINPSLVESRQSSGKSYASYRPITFAVLSGDRDIIKTMVAVGGKVQYLEGQSSMNSENTLLGRVPSAKTPIRTVLSFSEEKELQDFLVSLGAVQYVSWSETKLSRIGIIVDDNVNFREAASTTSKPIRKLQRKEKVDVLGIDPRLVKIGNSSGVWFNVKDSHGVSGWVYGDFLDNTSWYE